MTLGELQLHARKWRLTYAEEDIASALGQSSREVQEHILREHLQNLAIAAAHCSVSLDEIAETVRKDREKECRHCGEPAHYIDPQHGGWLCAKHVGGIGAPL